MADKRKYVQGMKYRLYGSGIASSDTSVRLTSMTLPNSGDLVTMAMFGEKGYATIEPGNRSREENISFTGITQNIDGSATLTGVTRGIELVDPYAQDLAQRKSHAGGVVISITNSSAFYSDFANKFNDETIDGKYTFPSTAGVARPVISADTNSVLAEELITKGELNRAIVATFLTPTIVNTSSATTGTSTAGSLTWAHVSSGTDRLLTVQISTEQDKTITGVTYNGDALTQAASHTRVTGDLRTEIWYLIAPDLGTNNIVVTASSAAFISATALTLNSAHQTTPIGITGDADGSSTAPSVSVITTQVNSLIIDSVATASDPTTFTAGTNQSIQQAIEDTATRQIATSVEGTTSTGSYTMDYTIDPTGNWAITAVEIKGIANLGTDNYTVKATSTDTSPNYLDDKISIVSNDGSVAIVKTINNPAGNEDIEYDLSAIGSNSIVQLTAEEDITAGDTVGFATNIDDGAVKAAWATRLQSVTGVTVAGLRCLTNVGGDKYAFLYDPNPADPGEIQKIVIGTLDRGSMTWTFGTAVDAANNTYDAATICKVDTDKFVVVYITSAGDLYGYIGTVSGNSCTLSADTNMGSSAEAVIASVQLDTNIAAVVTSGGGQTVVWAIRTNAATPAVADSNTVGGVLGDTLTNEIAIEKVATNKVAIIVVDSIGVASYSGGFSGTWTNPANAVTLTAGDIQIVGLKSVSSDTFYTIKGSTASATVSVQYLTCSSVTTTLVSTKSIVLPGNPTFGTMLDDNSGVYALIWNYGIFKLNYNGSTIDYVPTAYQFDFATGSPSTSVSPTQSYVTTSDSGYFSAYGSYISGGTNNIEYHIQGLTPNYVGIAQDTVARGASVNVIISGINSDQTGLVAGGLYEPYQGGLIQTLDSTAKWLLQARNATDIIVR